MSQMPRWFRQQQYEQKLSHVLNNPLSDQASVTAARRAVEQKLDQDDFEFAQRQRQRTNDYLQQLRSDYHSKYFGGGE